MTKDDFETMTPFQREFLAELRKLRVAIEDGTKALEKLVETPV